MSTSSLYHTFSLSNLQHLGIIEEKTPSFLGLVHLSELIIVQSATVGKSSIKGQRKNVFGFLE